MLNRAFATDISTDRHVIGRVDEHYVSALRAQYSRIGCCSTALPHTIWCLPSFHRSPALVTGSAAPRSGAGHQNRASIAWQEQQVDLRDLKSGDRNIELALDRQKVLQFDREDRSVPPGLLRQPVISNHIGPDLISGQIYPTES